MNTRKQGMTHKGLFCGIVPVYLNPRDDPYELNLEPTSWVWDFPYYAVEGLFAIYAVLACVVNPNYEPAWPILITGELDAQDDI